MGKPTSAELSQKLGDLSAELSETATKLGDALQPVEEAEAAGYLDTSLFTRWNDLDAAGSRVDQVLKKLKEYKEKLEVRALDNLSKSGAGSVNIGGRTFFVRIERWARATDGNNARAVQVLKDNGLDDLVGEGFNVQTISAHVRELFARVPEPGEEEFDWEASPLSEGFTLSETPKLGHRTS